MYELMKFETKVGAIGKPLVVRLKDGNGYYPLDGCTVTFSMAKRGSSTNIVDDGACTIASPQTGDNIGKVTYAWGANDLNAKGTYDGDFKVFGLDGKPTGFPSLEGMPFIEIVVSPSKS